MRILLFSALLLPASAWAADPVALRLQDDASDWRAILTWELAVTSPAGERTERSGVLRGAWRLAGDHLDATELRKVRSAPRTDATSTAVTAALLAGFRAERPSPPEPEPEPEALPEAEPEPAPEATDAEPPAPVDAEAPSAADASPATAADAPPAPPAPPVVVAPAPPSPAAPAPPPAPAGPPDLAALLAQTLATSPTRMLWPFDGVALVPGSAWVTPTDAHPHHDAADEVGLKVGAAIACPDTGPSVSCVELSLARATGGAALDGTGVPSGAQRVVEVWTVEPGSLRPHAVRVEIDAAWAAPAGETPGVWRARAVGQVALLPAVPPTSP